MAASRTEAHIIQTNTNDIDPVSANQNQRLSCLGGYITITLITLSCIAIILGPGLLSTSGGIASLQDAGTAVLISGVLLLLLSTVLCRKIYCRGANRGLNPGTTTTAFVAAPPPGVASGMVEPPHGQGTDPLPIFDYSSQQPARQGSSQHLHLASNRYPLVPSDDYQYYRGSHVEPSAPDQPPPSYEEIMKATNNV